MVRDRKIEATAPPASEDNIVKKGKNKIRFSTNAKQVNSYPDMRNLYLRFDDIKINFY